MARIDPQAAAAVMLKAGYKPLEPFTKSHSKWKCLHIICGETVYPSYHSISQGQGGCFSCGRKVTADKRRLPEEKTVEIMLNANLEPLEAYTDAKTPWKSKCLECGKVVSPTLTNIKSGQSGCKFCSSKALGIKQTKPQEVAIQVMRGSFLEPLEPYQSGKEPWKCKCLNCGEVVYPRMSDVKKGGGGCKRCGTAKTIEALTIPEEKAFAVMLNAKVKPLVPYKRARLKWESECLECGRKVSPTLSAVLAGHAGCIFCANRKTDPLEATKIMLSAQLEPLVPYKSAHTRWKCKCLKCGNTVYPKYNNVSQNNGGCGFCAKKGIDLNKASYVYLITHEVLGAHKVGIGNVQENIRKDRLKGSRGFLINGWQIHRIWNTETGVKATEIETAVFRIIRRDLSLMPYLSKVEMPITRGESETVNADLISLLQLEKIINKVIKNLKQ
jgi:hypothetical protein